MQAQAKNYYITLNLSIATAKHGSNLASDAQDICDGLTRPNHRTSDYAMMKACLSRMKLLAANAHREATEIALRFRGIRRALIEVCHLLGGVRLSFR